MALKRLKVKMTQTQAKAGEPVCVVVAGDVVTRYNRADAAMKEAESQMKELRPEILELGTEEIFATSCRQPTDPVLTVKLEDEEGSRLRVQFTKRYGPVVDVEAAEALFDGLRDRNGRKVDINDYVQETVVGKFNSKVFLDAEGNFDPKIYACFRKAIETVAAELHLPCPLTTEKVVVPKETFHLERFKLFGSAEAQRRLSALMPNTTQIVPLAQG